MPKVPTSANLILIQGIFFQDAEWPVLAEMPGVGTAVAIKSGLFKSCFAGLIGQEVFGEKSEWVGRMKDHFGESTIRDFKMDAKGISFTKQYDGRLHVIEYKFAKKVGIFWEGTFKKSAVGSGTARCIVTEVDERFLLPNHE